MVTVFLSSIGLGGGSGVPRRSVQGGNTGKWSMGYGYEYRYEKRKDHRTESQHMGAHKHMGVSKHTGGIQPYGGCTETP